MVLMVNNPSLDDVTQSFVNRETTNLNLLKGIGATFKRNIKIIMQYKIILLVGFFNTFIYISLAVFIAKLVPGEEIAADGYIVSSFSFIIAGALTMDLTTKILMKSLNSFVSEQKQGTFETLTTLPFGLKKYCLSEIFFEMVYAIVLFIVYNIPIFFIFNVFYDVTINIFSILSLLLLVLALLLLFFSLSLLAANFTILIKRGKEVAMVIIGILQLLSGSIFPLYLFPQWLKIVAYTSPFTHAVRAIRFCLFGGGNITDSIVWISIIILLVSAVLLYFLFNWTHKKIYRRIQLKGTVHEY